MLSPSLFAVGFHILAVVVTVVLSCCCYWLLPFCGSCNSTVLSAVIFKKPQNSGCLLFCVAVAIAVVCAFELRLVCRRTGVSLAMYRSCAVLFLP